MRVLEAIDRLLRRFLDIFETLPRALSRAADRVLEALKRYTDYLVELIRTAVSVIVRFLREFLVSLWRLIWQLVKLVLVTLVFCYLFAFGMTIQELGAGRSLKVIGWFLAITGILGVVLMVVAVLASFAKDGFARSEANTTDSKQRHETRLVGFVFADFLAVLMVLMLTYFQPSLNLRWWPLNWTQVVIQTVEKDSLEVARYLDQQWQSWQKGKAGNQ